MKYNLNSIGLWRKVFEYMLMCSLVILTLSLLCVGVSIVFDAMKLTSGEILPCIIALSIIISTVLAAISMLGLLIIMICVN